MNGLIGNIVVVTGGASGIGRATCQLLSKLGASIVVADIDTKLAEETKNSLTTLNGTIQSQHMFCYVDIAVSKSVENLAQEIENFYKKPAQAIINCAAIAQQIDTLECTDELVDQTIDVNLKGTFYVNKIFLREMRKASVKGVFVNVSSKAKYGYEKLTIYAASKAGLDGLTKSFAKEFGPEGYRFNVLSPGLTRTPMAMQAPEGIEIACKRISLKRIAEPEEIANVCAFLISDASSYINGAVLDVDGGIQ